MPLLEKDLEQSKKGKQADGRQQQYVEIVCDDISYGRLGNAHEKATELIAYYEGEDYEVTHLSTATGSSRNDQLFITLVFTRK